MRIKPLLLCACLLAVVSVAFLSQRSAGQSTAAPSLITQTIDEGKLVVLQGNTHPLARAKYDQGPAPANLAMDRMMLVLKTTPAQGAALETLLAQQQDRSSPNYHKWLTPQEFGAQFGVSDADVQKITSWLETHGFQIDSVANGRNVIQFSGNAGQVQSAFHTAIHKYTINSQEQWANTTDPSIPAALTPAVAGVASLNNFPRKAAHRLAGTFQRDMATGKLKAVKPEFTYAAGCQGTTGSECYGVAPYDFATIYNILPLWNAGITGTGQTIAIVSDSDINPADLTNFRSLFGLPAANFQRTYTPGFSSSNPGIQSCADNGDECEADIDVEWSGAVAPGAGINLVISKTGASFGGDISAQFIIDNPAEVNNAKIIGYSYGECEFFLGTAGNAFYGGSPTVKDSVGEWKQAAAEGITVIVSTGDTGSAGCDSDTEQVAQFGIAVNGVASTPYNVAVGGTDFNDATNPTTYWNSSNPSTTTEASVKGYIPETTYNDTCTNTIIEGLLDLGGDIETDCNELATEANLNFLVAPAGGGGGVSACTTSDVNNGSGEFSSCAGGYAKPSWQTALTVADGRRDLPDVAIFAGDQTVQNFYLYCDSDLDSASGACSLASSASGTSQPFPLIQGVGGTSVSTQVFAGMVALLNQSTGSPQGLVNTNLYALAGQSWAKCQSGGAQTSACIFNQVTSGTIAMPCDVILTAGNGATGCDVLVNTDEIGETYQSNNQLAYNAGAGYNLATGLGSLNVASLVNNWSVGSGGADFVISSSPAAVTVSTAGGTGSAVLTVVAVNGFTDTVAFSPSSCSGLPTGATCSFTTSPVSANGTTTLTITTAAAAAAPPAVRPLGSSRWTTGTFASLACAFAIAIILLISASRNRRWSTAAACAVFLMALGIVACGGGGSSSSNSPPPPPNVVEPVAVTITGTSTAGKVSHTTTVMLTAE
ncbi:MAG TPA: S53 family peptidase [Candidatus Acidoferrales bacterium]